MNDMKETLNKIFTCHDITANLYEPPSPDILLDPYDPMTGTSPPFSQYGCNHTDYGIHVTQMCPNSSSPIDVCGSFHLSSSPSSRRRR